MNIDEWVYELLDVCERAGARRILIDSLADVALAADDDSRFREWMYSLARRCARAGISLMMTLEVPELFELHRISESGLSHLADNVVLLQYQREDSRLRRMLTVLKTRASRHDPLIRPFEITAEGIRLAAGLPDASPRR
jgi:circadian clock protein KaiC